MFGCICTLTVYFQPLGFSPTYKGAFRNVKICHTKLVYRTTSMTRTSMVRLPWWFELIFESRENSSHSSRKQIFMDILGFFFFFFFFFFFVLVLLWKCLFVLTHGIVSYNGWVHSKYHYYEEQKHVPKLSPFASWSGAKINHYENTPIQIYWKIYKQTKKIQIRNSDIFSYFFSKHRLWVPVRTASPRRLQRVHTISVF